MSFFKFGGRGRAREAEAIIGETSEYKKLEDSRAALNALTGSLEWSFNFWTGKGKKIVELPQDRPFLKQVRAAGKVLEVIVEAAKYFDNEYAKIGPEKENIQTAAELNREIAVLIELIDPAREADLALAEPNMQPNATEVANFISQINKLRLPLHKFIAENGLGQAGVAIELTATEIDEEERVEMDKRADAEFENTTVEFLWELYNGLKKTKLGEELFDDSKVHMDRHERMFAPFGATAGRDSSYTKYRDSIEFEVKEEQRDKTKITKGLVGIDTAEAWRLRDRMLADDQELILRLKSNNLFRGWFVNNVTASIGVERIMSTLAGLDSPRAWDLRHRFFDSPPNDGQESEENYSPDYILADSLIGLDSPEAWDMRAKLIEKHGYKIVLSSLAGLDSEAAWKIRDQFVADIDPAHPPGIGDMDSLQMSLVGLDSQHAWELRDKILVEKNRGDLMPWIVENIAGLDSAKAWDLREQYLKSAGASDRVNVNIFTSLMSLDSERAWGMRDRVSKNGDKIEDFFDWSGLAGLKSERARNMREEILKKGKARLGDFEEYYKLRLAEEGLYSNLKMVAIRKARMDARQGVAA